MASTVSPKVSAQTLATAIGTALAAAGGYALNKYTGFGNLSKGVETAIGGGIATVILPLVVWIVGWLRDADGWIRKEAAHLGAPAVSAVAAVEKKVEGVAEKLVAKEDPAPSDLNAAYEALQTAPAAAPAAAAPADEPTLSQPAK